MTTREEILQAIKTRLEGITAANGYPLTVKTVDIGFQQLSNKNRSAFPLVLISPQSESDDSETTGGSGSRYHRNWPIEIAAIMAPGTKTAREDGEVLISSIVARLVEDQKFGLTPAYGLGFILDSVEAPDEWESDTNNLAFVLINIVVRYTFRPMDVIPAMP